MLAPKKPPPGQEDGFPKCLQLAAWTIRKIALPPLLNRDKFRNPRAVKEARLELLREAVHEACGFIRLHAEVCQGLAEAGDDAGMLHSFGRLVTYTKHAARVGNELRDLRKEPP